MASLCNDACADFTLTTILSAACKIDERRRALKRIGFYKCNITIPDTPDCAALAALMAPTGVGATPGLVFSNELQDVAFADPTTVSREISDTRPEFIKKVSRQLTAKERIGLDIDAAGAPAKFYDWSWWKNIDNVATQLNFLLLYDDGTLEIPRAEGSLVGMPATLQVWRGQEKVQAGYIVDLKSLSINFLGDPLSFDAPTISLNTCPDLAGLF